MIKKKKKNWSYHIQPSAIFKFHWVSDFLYFLFEFKLIYFRNSNLEILKYKIENLLKSEIIRRIDHQLPDKKKVDLSDYIIENDNWKNTLIEFENVFKKLNLSY